MNQQLNRHYDLIRRYLSPPAPDWFWRWGESGNVLLWRDGQTIAFREELIAVLQHQTSCGLPPLDCVVLLLAATRASWPQAKEQVTIWSRLDDLRHDHEPGIMEQLDAVHALPAERRNTMEAKVELATLVFEKFENRLTPAVSQTLLQALTAGPEDNLLKPRSTGAKIWEPRRSISAAFLNGLDKVEAEILRLRSQVGLDNLPGPAPDLDDLPPVARARSLVESLQKDEQLGGLARVARRLMGAVHLPPQVSEHQDLPLGGVSDLTSRGELDRLLLSELAYDDLTLAVRVALNEALYLRRESPPQSPPSARALLIDTGIRMWGIPRVFAAAVGLALVAASGNQTRIASFRPRGAHVVPTDLTTRGGLIEHLAALEPDPHPGAALGPLFEASVGDQEPVDCVVITAREVARDPDFQRALANLPAPSLYLATVSREGTFRLEQRGPHGSHLVRAAELDLDKLFASPARSQTSLVDPSLCPALPHIFSIKPFPLRLFTFIKNILQSWPVPGHGSLSLTQDGRLLHSDRNDRAAIQIAEHLPYFDRLYWSSPVVKEGKLQAVAGRIPSSRIYLLQIDLNAPSCQSFELVTNLSLEYVHCVCAHNGALFVRDNGGVQVYERSTGRWIKAVAVPGNCCFRHASSACTRFARCKSPHSLTTQWYALTFDGADARWEQVTCGTGESLPALQCLFERRGQDGPIGVGPQGDLFCTATGKWTRLQSLMGEIAWVSKVSSRGNMLALYPNSQPKRRLVPNAVPIITTLTGAVTWVDEKQVDATVEQAESPQLKPIAPNGMASLHTGFESIQFDQRHDLALVAHTGHLWRVVLVEWIESGVLCHRLELRHDTYHTIHGDRCDCQRLRANQSLRNSYIVQEHPVNSYRLRVARWHDGSRAYFDSRGLLHLVSSDPKLPETTIVLYESELSGWCADGRMWGSDYFTGGRSNTSARKIYEEVLRPFARGVAPAE